MGVVWGVSLGRVGRFPACLTLRRLDIQQFALLPEHAGPGRGRFDVTLT